MMQPEALPQTPYSYPASGPTQYRRPTDWVCAAIFLVMWFCIAIIGIVYTRASTPEIGKPRDYDHNVCTGQYPYLYIASFDTKRTVCIKSCPTTSGVLIDCMKNSRFKYCPVSRGSLITNHFYLLCHTKDADLQYHTNKTHARTFAGEIIQGVEEISQTAAIITAIGASMLLVTVVLPGVVTCVYVIIFEILLAALGMGFVYLYATGYMPFFQVPSAITSHQSPKQSLYLFIGIAFLITAAVTSTLACLQSFKIRQIMVVVRLSKKFLKENWGMLFISVLLCALSLSIIALLIHLLQMTQSNVKVDFQKHGAYNQLAQKKGESISLILFVSFAYLWSHGFMIALSSFVAEAAAVIWYFNMKVPEHTRGFTSIFRMIGFHFGTICYQGIFVYFPEFLREIFCDKTSNIPCLSSISIYSFIQTILKGSHLTIANEHCQQLLVRVQQSQPHKYMMGRAYVQLSKALIWASAILICAFLLAQDQPYFFSYKLYLLPPLLVMTLLSLEIGTHFSELLGTVGDTLAIIYTVDTEANGYTNIPDDINFLMQNNK